MKTAFTHAQLKDVLSYDSETGEFTWLALAGHNHSRAGMTAGAIDNKGYRVIGVYRGTFLAHRLAWFYVHGEWPTSMLDHINGDPADNRLANLRLSSSTHNRQNLRKATAANRSSGLLGATFHKQTGRWQAFLRSAGKNFYLGLHDTPEAAHEAYVAAKRKIHEGCTI